MPLSAWLGWTQSPGEVPGFGPLDAADSRTLADLLGRNPANQWCVTLTNRAGHPVAHACARPGPRPRPETTRPRHLSQPRDAIRLQPPSRAQHASQPRNQARAR